MKKLLLSFGLMVSGLLMFGQVTETTTAEATSKTEMKKTCSSKKECTPGSCIGVSVKEMDGRLHVASVSEEGPAAKAGLQEGDILVAANGTEFSTEEGLVETMWSHKAKEPIEFQVERDGEVMTKSIEMAMSNEAKSMNKKSCSGKKSKTCCAKKTKS